MSKQQTLIEMLALKEQDRDRLVREAQAKIVKTNKVHNYMITSCQVKNGEGRLSGIPFLVKDNISTKDVLTTGSSRILDNYYPPFSATVVDKLLREGAVMLGKTTLDELAVGGTGTTGFTGVTTNPWDKSRKAGGSSGGSAAAVACGAVPFALGTDTGDSIRKPASYTGIVGFKPTYGRLSRYGVFPFACSLDHVGMFTRSVADAALLTDILAGEDQFDLTSLPTPPQPYYPNLDSNIKGKKFAVIKEIMDSIRNQEVKDLFLTTIEQYRTGGATIDYISMDMNLLKSILPVYLIISCAETTSNNANLTSIAFGRPRGDSEPIKAMQKARTAGLGKMIKRRFIIGSYVLEAEQKEKYFLKAQKIRRVINNEFSQVLKKYQAIILPAAPSIATKIDDISHRLTEEYLLADNFMAFANFTGMPSITIPMGFVKSMPIGINITTAFGTDQETLNYAYYLEQKLGLKNVQVEE